MTNLGFSQEKLAAALELVVFTEGDVLEAILEAKRKGSAPVGYFPLQGQAKIQIHPMLCCGADDCTTLQIVVFNGYVAPIDVDYNPYFDVVLKTKDGSTLSSNHEPSMSPDDTPITVVTLPNPGKLIGAQLELTV